MKICFLDNSSFIYNSKDLNSPKLRGAETVLINLSNSLQKMGHDITILNNCPINEQINNIHWININSINEKFIFDLAVSNNDCNLFDKIIAKNKVLLSHSIQSFEKFIRKKQFFSFFKHKPKVALLSKYHYSKRSFLTKIFGHFFLPYGVDDIFINNSLNDISNIDSKQAIFTSRTDRNAELLIDIWKKKIFPHQNNLKLLVTPGNFKDIENFNIYLRNLGSRQNMIDNLNESRVFLIPGHKAELYCLAAEEARELCIPIITLGIGSLSERVIHNKTGFIAKNQEEFANYTLEVFRNDSLWKELRSNLLILRGNKTWHKSAKTLIESI